MDITDDDQEAFALVPKYVDVSTTFQRHMISVVVFFSSNRLQSMLVNYTVTDMGCFDDQSTSGAIRVDQNRVNREDHQS